MAKRKRREATLGLGSLEIEIERSRCRCSTTDQLLSLHCRNGERALSDFPASTGTDFVLHFERSKQSREQSIGTLLLTNTVSPATLARSANKSTVAS
eukprot:scaffold22787_cov78-Skeletonema_dohrnii-CCMP3373.AAC.1